MPLNRPAVNRLEGRTGRTISIRGVPDPLLKKIHAKAKLETRSLNNTMIVLLSRGLEA